jgi:ribonuclease HI
MKGDNSSVPKPGKSSKFYGVKAGHAPGVYTDWPSVQEQITGYKGSKHKSFATLAEAQAFVNESKRTTPSEASASISLKGHLDTSTLSVADTQRPSKKLKRNDGAAMVPAIKDEYEPGFGPLPPDAEDGFDRTIKLHPTGLVHKSEAELNRHKKQPTGDFEGELNIWTDGAARGNGKVGCLAGIGIWFGAHDSR